VISKLATALILNPKNQLLLVKRRKETAVLPDKWGYPGGTIELGQTIEEAIHAEVKPETGFDVKISKIGKECEIHAGNKMIIAIPVLCRTETSEVTLDFEHTDFKWINPKDLLLFDLGVPRNEVVDMVGSVGLNL
jgi:8-oxo-dGTP pyrophosphatase MutT (NUDIX family)